MASPIDTLNAQFGVPGSVFFELGRGGLPRIVVDAHGAQVHVYLQGAHITHYQRTDGEPVLFTSERSLYEPGKAIRGGVPVIFPWFGPRPSDGQMHGFVRTRSWDVESVVDDRAKIRITLTTHATNESHAIWPHDFVARLQIDVGAALRVSLEIGNRGSAPLAFECALHSYFAVADVRNITLRSLRGTEYVDKLRDSQRVRQEDDAIRPTASIDRVYVNSPQTCVIDDPGFARRVIVEKTGSLSTVVWNPWSTNMSKFADLAPDDWLRYLCVETANARENAIQLAPGQSHVMTATIRTEPLR